MVVIISYTGTDDEVYIGSVEKTSECTDVLLSLWGNRLLHVQEVVKYISWNVEIFEEGVFCL